MSSIPDSDLLQMATQLTSAHISKNEVLLENVPNVLNFFYKKLIEAAHAHAKRSPSSLNPAVPVNESVKHDYIVCLEDGKKLQMLKRHLFTVYGMTPEQYRERWGLNADYPMVSPGYAKRRSRIARDTGLGYTGHKKKRLEVVGNSAESAVVVKSARAR